jgi:hypothetical protein
MATLILITRRITPGIQSKLRSLVRVGIDAYIMSDEKPEIHSKRILHIPDEEMKELGWTHHMSNAKNMITAWDKATYYAYTTKKPHVWLCEDDVFWNRPSVMKLLTDVNIKSDLIASAPIAESYWEQPSWFHWEKVGMLTKTKKSWASTLNQLCRLSSRLLERMHELSVSRKRLYFHEGMFVTLCNLNGYPYTYIDRLDIPVTVMIRWNKPFTPEQVTEISQQNKMVILHPVKETGETR